MEITLLQEAASKIRDREPKQHKTFSMALAAALYLEKDNPQACISPRQIEAIYGIPVEVQVECAIALKKDAAFQFLKQIGRGMSLAQVKRKFSADYYKSMFGRKVSKLGEKAIILTYGEILHLSRYLVFDYAALRECISDLQLPETVEIYLNSGDGS